MASKTRKQLEQIPGVGRKIAQDLRSIGLNSVDDLKGRSPEKLYKKLCDVKAAPIDKCVLYILRCAVYYASNKNHDPNLLKWHNWKNKKSPLKK